MDDGLFQEIIEEVDSMSPEQFQSLHEQIKAPSREEYKRNLYAIIERALTTSIVVRREGLLALESSLDSDKVANRDIFEYGLRFVIDGTDYAFIDKILSNLIKQEKDEYQITLKTIQKEAVLAIQSGDNPRMIVYLLNSYTDIPLSDPVFTKIIEEEGY